ncbi:MAG: CoA ester lyase [Chloroflexi bacterium]|nr:MAG: CoA ester lyase [Chloroflexota bacterium]
MRLRRSELSTPASNERMIAKAAASAADLVFLDLEDSVAPSEKVASREKVIHALQTLDFGKKTRAVRINDLETEYAYQDIISIVEEAGDKLDIIIIPKIKSGKDVWWVDLLLTQIEKRLHRSNPIGLEAQIEEVEALQCVEEIARSSPRLEALIFGQYDYAASQGVDPRAIEEDSMLYESDIWHYARNKIVIAARAAGIDAIDGPFIDYQNAEGFRRACVRVRTLGFSGKWAIHPGQIELANGVFAPSDDDIAWARKLDALYKEAQEKGLGAVTYEGKMVDVALIRNARNIIQKADLIGK